MRSVFRSVRADGSARPHDYSNGAETRLLFSVALCPAVIASPIFGDPISTDWPRAGDRNNPRHFYSSRWIHTVEPGHECVERRCYTRTVPTPHIRVGTTRRPR